MVLEKAAHVSGLISGSNRSGGLPPKKTTNQNTVGGIQIVNIIFEVHMNILIQSLSINPHADSTTALQHSQLK